MGDIEDLEELSAVVPLVNKNSIVEYHDSSCNGQVTLGVHVPAAKAKHFRIRMNLLPIKKPDEDKDELDDDDNSTVWSLPSWPELEHAQYLKDRRIRRIMRARAKRRALKELEEAKRLAARGAEVSLHPVATVPGSDGEEGEEDEDDEPEDMKQRGRWNNQCEFLLSIISMSVGMGNFYRFPFVAYQNGGGAFLIPYLLVLTFVGRPMYLMELAVGQFCSYGQVKCWEMAPFFRGVGYGAALGSFCVVSYYSSVMATTIYYLVNSFRVELPWSYCSPDWAGEETCDNLTNALKENDTLDAKQLVNLPQMYFEKKVMNEKPGIEDGIGPPLGVQTGCLFLSWVIIYMVIARGVQSSGKIAYFTTFYPYVIIITMLAVACTQEGAVTGMLYFITPDWQRIKDPNVWFAATGQCFFSLSTGFGPIINYASYNPFHHAIYRDAMIVSFMDTLASLLAGLTVFATLGNIAHALDKEIDQVVSSGPGLVFVSFSDAISNISYVPQLLSVLFFSMLLTLAIGSAVAWQMATVAVICDQFPKLSKFWVTLTMCMVGFLVALIYVTPGGQFMLTLVDNFGGNVNIYILATLECIGISWVYGLNNFCKDVEFMLNKKVSWYWKICWGFIIPVLLTGVMIYSFATAKPLEHNGHLFPTSAIVCGWLLTLTTLMFVPILAIYAMYKQKGTLKQRFLASLKPTAQFGPRRPSDKERWRLFRLGIIAHGGPSPDTYKLPTGETPEHNTLPEWLTVDDDGKVKPKKDVLDPELPLPPDVQLDIGLEALKRAHDLEHQHEHPQSLDHHEPERRDRRFLDFFERHGSDHRDHHHHEHHHGHHDHDHPDNNNEQEHEHHEHHGHDHSDEHEHRHHQHDKK